jgi:hypothetical protein
VEIESYAIHGWPPGWLLRHDHCDRVYACGAQHCHHVAVEVQPLHTN